MPDPSRIDGRYILRGALGKGGIGSVFEVFDEVVDRVVALKLLRFDDEASVEAFRREFTILSNAAHPRLPRAFDFCRGSFEARPVHYYTAEIVRGSPLGQYARGRSWSEVLSALGGPLDALAWLHDAGIVHGDFKPDNVLVGTDGAGTLIDLSAARAASRQAAEVSGTRHYIAPEVLAGVPPTPRSDLFGVGRTLERLLGVIDGSPPDRVRRLVPRLVASDPQDRPSDAREVLDLLIGQAKRERESPGEPGVLLGRDEEVAAFDRALSALVRGEAGPRVVVISAGEGMGKSRLFRELVWRAQLACAVFEGVPSKPLGSLMARAVGRPVEDGVDAVLRARAELGRAPPAKVVCMDDADRLEDGERAVLEALLRATERSDAVLFVVTTSEPFLSEAGVDTERALRLPIGPLAAGAIRRWTRPFLTAASGDEVARLSGGVPRALRAICSAVAAGSVSEADLGSFEDPAGLTPVELRQLAAMGDAAARALAAVSTCEAIGTERAARVGVSEDALGELERRGLARFASGAWQLAQPSRQRALVAALPSEVVSEVARAIASDLDGAAPDETPRAQSERLAARSRALAACGRAAEARRLIVEAELFYEHAPRAWVRALDAALDADPQPLTVVAAAAALEAAGDPRRALSLLARAMRARPPSDLGAEIALRAARQYEKLGREGAALRALARAVRRGVGPADPRLAAVRARCALRLGRYEEAATEARRALAYETNGEIAADLHEALGVALGYLGDHASALTALSRAVSTRGRSGSPRARFRSLSHHALAAYRAGDTQLAARAFAEALDVAEAESLGDLLATAALNLGTARHQLGAWGEALACYERGLRAAIAFGKTRTALTLRFNIAKIHADIGTLDRAETTLEHLRGAEAAPAASDLAAAVLGLDAEIAAARGDRASATTLLERIRALHAERGARRELGEATVHAAEVALAAGDLARSAELARQAGETLASLDASDLSLRLAAVSAWIALGEDDPDAALAHVRRGEELVSRVAQLELRARLEEVAAAVYRRRSARTLAGSHQKAALECWERIASSLPAELSEAFWRHPHRAHLPREEPAPELPARADLVMRVLEINRRLSCALETADVLRLAMDAAIELTGAERGFVILAPVGTKSPSKLEVVIARNLDKETVGKSQLKFSHGIARRVVDSGQPLLTVDALSDERFKTNASVHGMRLRSIVCVPIRAAGGVLGALYVDNRFTRGKFGPSDADVLGAFADQVAVALHNGRLMDSLRQRTRELEEEQRRVAELMRSQASEIDRLAHELERERTRTETAREFPDIAGRSAPMRKVLALVDRVAASDVPVTITGESGTGKELVARAIHANGPRRDGPFVAVNCAALPENLLESELFGHVRGAFTGAIRDHGGLFVAARGGTLFLDEIGETPLSVQAKLLRALQEREVRPVGSDRSVVVADVRVLCATNRLLVDEVSRGRFREDLFYRISVIEIRLPPLRDRPDDIPALAQAILDKLAARQGRAPWHLSNAALRRLVAHPWPGNVRQLENVLARASVLATGVQIGPADLELPPATPPARVGRSRAEHKKLEEERIRSALELCRWNVCEVSRTLGMPRTTLYRKLERYGLVR